MFRTLVAMMALKAVRVRRRQWSDWGPKKNYFDVP